MKPFKNGNELMPMEDLDYPKTVAKWLRYCGDKIDRCHKCPYGCAELDETESTCMDKLHNAAASIIERQNNLPGRNSYGLVSESE